MIHDTRSTRRLVRLLCLVAALASAHGTAQAEGFRYRQPLKADTGWVRLTLPNEVLQECRPDLGDLRVLAGSNEVPYALEEELVPASQVLEFRNVESHVGRETTALLDRGEHAAASDWLELSIASSTAFLKPVVVESSQDGVSFARVAQGSVFRTPAVSNLRIGFAPNDRRYLRVQLDDRSSAPIQPVSAALHLSRNETPLQSYRLAAKPTAGPDVSFDTYAVELPAANLHVASLDIETGESAFARTVRAYDLLLFRDELSRRLISEGLLSRSPTGSTPVALQLNANVGRRLEIEVEHLGNRLPVQGVTVLARPRVLLFNAPTGALQLAYGQSTAAAPRYDIATALRAGPPPTWGTATLAGGAIDQPNASESLRPRRGQRLDVTSWERRQPVSLPSHGTLAYLDLGGPVVSHLASVRIVDGSGAQVPYLVESDFRHTSLRLQHRIAHQGAHTKITISGLDPDAWVEAVGFSAVAPEYFERSLEINEVDPNTRGRKAKRQLGRAVWKRAPGEARSEFWIPIEKPHASEIELDIDNGDDAALAITSVLGRLAIKRVDFEFSPKEQLSLFWRNPQASPPRYDLPLIANRVFSSPALPASLGPLELTHPVSPAIPKWFWAAAIVAGLIIALVLARAMMSNPSPKAP